MNAGGFIRVVTLGGLELLIPEAVTRPKIIIITANNRAAMVDPKKSPLLNPLFLFSATFFTIELGSVMFQEQRYILF